MVNVAGQLFPVTDTMRPSGSQWLHAGSSGKGRGTPSLSTSSPRRGGFLPLTERAGQRPGVRVPVRKR